MEVAKVMEARVAMAAKVVEEEDMVVVVVVVMEVAETEILAAVWIVLEVASAVVTAKVMEAVVAASWFSTTQFLFLESTPISLKMTLLIILDLLALSKWTNVQTKRRCGCTKIKTPECRKEKLP